MRGQTRSYYVLRTSIQWWSVSRTCVYICICISARVGVNVGVNVGVGVGGCPAAWLLLDCHLGGRNEDTVAWLGCCAFVSPVL